MHTQAEVIEIINRFLGLINSEFPLSGVYLFGSYVNGTAREYSDIDLAIVSDVFEGSRFFDKKKLNKYLLKSSVDLEIHPYRTEDFTEDDPFVKEIIKTGIKIL